MKFILVLIISIFSISLIAQADYFTRFKGGALLLPENRGQIDLLNDNTNSFNGRSYWFIQFYEIPTLQVQEELARLDVRLLEYIPEKTYISSLPNAFDIHLLKSFQIRAIHAINKDYKLAPGVLELITLSKGNASKKLEFVIHTYNDIPKNIIISKLEALNITVLKLNAETPFFHCILPLEDIQNLAAHAFISYIDKPTPIGEKEDRGARALHRTSAIDNELKGGLHYDGTGVNVCVRDDGKIGPHIDYKNRLDQSLTYANQSFSTHGDMVSGILFGGGNLNPDVTGTAKGAFLYLLDYEADFMDETLMLHKDKHVVITSSSYSDGCNDGYTDYAYTVDKQIYDYPTLMHVFSAGNVGNTDCGYGAGQGWGNITGGHKMGKNSIAVGNTDELGVLDNTSSRGPANDGRIKPDICAQGTSQLSTYPNNTINFGGGTSAAAPGVSGVLAELNQAYRELNNGLVPSSALLKACILNTANDLATPGPDFSTGWGQVNALRAFNIINKMQYWTNSVSQSEKQTNSIKVPTGTKRLNVMIYWAEKPAAVMSSKALINDLDLTLTDSLGNKFMPWILDPTPVSDSLAKPATKGEDHLNNMEQVSIDKPAAGNYNINVNGYSVPMGIQSFWIVYEIISDTPKIVFPYGEESFNPKELINIQWDAASDEGDFTLDYSLNDGQNWTFIKKVKGNLRRAYWQTLANPTEKLWLRISRNGNSNVMQQAFTILKQIDTVHIDKICPDYVSLSWDTIPSASKYIIYRLGDKYMEAFDTVSINKVSFSIVNPGIEQWYSIQPVWANGTKGKRSVAKKVQNLYDCTQAVDLAITNVDDYITSKVLCENDKLPININISNNGLDTIYNYSIGVEYSTGKKFSKDIIQPLVPGTTISYTIDTIIALQSGDFTVKLFVDALGESAFFNDTILLSYNLEVQSGNGSSLPVINGFEEPVFPPFYWTVYDPIQDITWNRIDCIGADGKMTKAAWMNNFSNPTVGNTDDLITEKYDLQNINKAYLVFDYSYAMYDFTTQDSLAIDVSTDCGTSFPNRIYYNGGEALQTAGVQENQYTPTFATDWKKMKVDLSQFIGESISFRFRNISGYGNSLCIDNVKVLEELKPYANIVSNDSIACLNTSVSFYAESSDVGNYLWNFGDNANPATAVGQGPHAISYSNNGFKNIKLCVSDGFVVDSNEININIEANPDAKFSFNPTGKLYQFTSLNNYPGWTHFWDFGDGNNSTDVNPIHMYTISGNINVQHQIESYCGNNKSVQNILLSSVKDQTYGISIFPNPVKDDLIIHADYPIERVTLCGVDGTLFMSFNNKLKEANIKMEVSDLPTGIYFVKLISAHENFIYKISKL